MLLVSNYVIWLIVLVINDETSALSYNQPKICSNATWCENGSTLVDNSTLGGGPARGLFVDYNDTIFVAAHKKSQILVWSTDSVCPVRTMSVNLYVYTPLFVTINGDIYFENGSEKGRIEKWSMNSNNSTFVMRFSDYCFSLFIDINNTLYCSHKDRHRVVKISLNGKNDTGITVAGTDSAGSAPKQLNQPWGIFVDTNFNLYVADGANNRIQLFQSGQLVGETVAGNRIPQDLTLDYPTDVVLDADNYLYIGDNRHGRVIRSGHNGWQCVIGCSDKRGSAPNELRDAYSLRFDSRGNIYVADEHNRRIQKFTLTKNSCETSATTMPTTEYMERYSSIVSTVEPFQQITSSVLYNCSNELAIGPYCNISNAPCGLLQPCENNSTCSNTNMALHGYYCSCSSGFSGRHCEIDGRPCKSNTCLNNGTCNATSDTEFSCQCAPGWEGAHCERLINYCQGVKCENQGVCRPLLLDYKCECVGDNFYSGRHCEIETKRIIIFKTVSKSFGYIAILAIVIVVMFVIIMDILKYCFGIDPTHEELERIRREKLAKKRKPVIQRFVYVNAPLPSQDPIPTVEETAV